MQKWELLICQFWPKILFFSWVPSFGSYVYEQNLNCPLGLKRADSCCPWPYGPQQPESARFRFLSSIYNSNHGTHEKNKIFGQNWPIDSCFPILKWLIVVFVKLFGAIFIISPRDIKIYRACEAELGNK